MSCSIDIPARKSINYGPADSEHQNHRPADSPSTSSSYSTSPQTPIDAAGADSRSYASATRGGHDRRPSLLSSSFSKQEHTVINIGEPNAPRLITCVRSGQGFDWNPDLFLSDHVETDFESAERRREPVHEIHLSDEEAKLLLPQ